MDTQNKAISIRDDALLYTLSFEAYTCLEDADSRVILAVSINAIFLLDLSDHKHLLRLNIGDLSHISCRLVELLLTGPAETFQGPLRPFSSCLFLAGNLLMLNAQIALQL